MTNREEVAERLRVYATDFDFGDSNPIWYVEKAVFNDIRIREQGRVFSSLADLIDPTCHMSCEYGSGDKVTEEYMEEIAGTHEDTVACHCHSCDTIFRYERGIIPNYCPNCGARVVREPETLEQAVKPADDYIDNQTLALAT